MEDNSPHLFGLSPITIAIIGIIAASAGLLIYHFIVVLCFENSIASLIPTCKHTNDTGRMSKSDTSRLQGSGIKVPCNRV
ncbi:hypothetical protein Peur_043245 [Populus x canadensis]